MYILEDQTTGRFYIGQTDDLERRLAQHSDNTLPTSRYTRKGGPWLVVWSERHTTRAEAVRRERFIKSRKSSAWIRRFLLGGRASPDVHRD